MKLLLKIILISQITIIFAANNYNQEIDFARDYRITDKPPAEMFKNENISNQILSSLQYIKWTHKGKILNLYIIDKYWTIERNEFTGITEARYIKAVILFEHNNDSMYHYLIPCYFMQNASFFGLKYGDVYYRMALVYDIKKIKK